ncbi:flippase activity-associated protein Agl23 [Methanolacinia paynteri]|uniref:flippase activity-associated protein Agl23 n=1 Tax=Methanolacinia paynteri TaxID=230356 RepID=UPI00064FD690|nr:flippase activity-associated protein Agl23 [Methanolacinia paynteri]
MRAAELTSQFKGFFTFERTLVLIFLVSLLFRLAFLDLKLLHHDEAIHSWFSYRLLTLGEYSYDPVYHGPFLYYVTAGVFSFLGASEFTARLIPAILGSTLCLFVYPVYRLGYLNRIQAIVAAVFFAISPDLVYFSRFLRNDIFVVFFTLVILVAALYYIEKGKLRYALIAGAGVGFGMSCKENMPIVVLIFAVFLLYLVYSGKWKLPRLWIRDLACTVIIAVGIMAVFYSSFGAVPEMLMTGWQTAIEHWLAMHEEQRLGGPPYVYILLFILYELPIFLLAIYSVYRFFMGGRSLKRKRKQFLPEEEAKFPEDLLEGDAETVLPEEVATTSDENLCTENPVPVVDSEAGTAIDEVKEPLGKPTGLSLPVIDKKTEFARFCIFWMIASMAAYAYIGEKVPWLILHQLVPMIFVSVIYIERWKVWVPVLASVFLIVMMLHVAFTPADINEPIVQVQNSEELKELFTMIDASDKVAVDFDERWPIAWYYYSEEGKKVSYVTDMNKNIDYLKNGDFDLIIVHDDKNLSVPGYEKYTTLKKSYWFSYYDNKDRLIPYYFLRDGKVGSLNYDVLVRTNSSWETV